jgi:hypothetical protein
MERSANGLAVVEAIVRVVDAVEVIVVDVAITIGGVEEAVEDASSFPLASLPVFPLGGVEVAIEEVDITRPGSSDMDEVAVVNMLVVDAVVVDAVDVAITIGGVEELSLELISVDVGVDDGVEVDMFKLSVDDVEVDEGKTSSVSDAPTTLEAEEIETPRSELSVDEVTAVVVDAVDVAITIGGVDVAAAISKVEDGSIGSELDATIVLEVEDEICVPLSSAEALRNGPLKTDNINIPRAITDSRKALEDIVYYHNFNTISLSKMKKFLQKICRKKNIFAVIILCILILKTL